MRTRISSWLVSLAVAMICIASQVASSQTSTSQGRQAPKREVSDSACDDTTINSRASAALRLVCQKTPTSVQSPSAATPLIVVGFVGGFVKPNDLRHPEPLFALYLRKHYGAGLHARVFSNHDEKDAKVYVLQLLDTDHDGALSTAERKKARIIIYGHSWGASETAAFARELGNLQIPVLLTIQLDIISKPRQKPDIIPPNVGNAINFYQSKGPLHGRSKIFASEPSMTTILGNVHMAYDRSPVNCDNYNWFIRTFNKPHHEIESDPYVWEQVASLIDAEVSSGERPNESRSSLTTRALQEPTGVVPQSQANKGMIGRDDWTKQR